MDHRYIDENDVAERYLEHALPADVHYAFESHFIDCEECTDRLLLAQIFLEHKPQKSLVADKEAALALLPLRAQFAARMKPWQLLVLAVLAAAALLALPTAYFFLELTRVHRAQ